MTNRPFENQEYTNLWVEEFDEKKLKQYHDKFFSRFEKNTKHREQIQFIGRYIRKEMKWLDAPIGSGRLETDLRTDHMIGFDRSPQFAEHNRKQGRTVVEGDLFDMPFDREFDIVTTMNTIFAFNNFEDALKQAWKALKPGGILIYDIPNRAHIQHARDRGVGYLYSASSSITEIQAMAESLGGTVLEVRPHDFYDNLLLLRFFEKKADGKFSIGSLIYRILNKLYFFGPVSRLYLEFMRFWPARYFMKYLVAIRKN